MDPYCSNSTESKARLGLCSSRCTGLRSLPRLDAELWWGQALRLGLIPRVPNAAFEEDRDF
jgi:hypothetical protein